MDRTLDDITEGDVIQVLADMMPRTGEGFVRVKEMARAVGRSPSTVRGYLHRLKEAGLLLEGEVELTSDETLGPRGATVPGYAIQNGEEDEQ